MKILKKSIAKWVDALRSGKYNQIRRNLNNADGHCCLGVAVCEFVPRSKIKTKFNDLIYGAYPSHQYHSPQWLKSINADFEVRTGVALSTANDFGITTGNSYTDPLTFDEIADMLQLIYLEEALSA